MSAAGPAPPRGPIRTDGREKVEGAFAYANDLHTAGMLWGATVRSPHPHAAVDRIDVSGAAALSGVHAVLTCADVRGRPTFGLAVYDQPVLASGVVRFHGEPVALVAAETQALAHEAARKVLVGYRPLRAVSDPAEAAQAPPLHPGRSNIVRELTIRRGDSNARGEVAVEGTYEVGMQDPAFLAPEACLAIPDGRGGLDLHVATQWLHADRAQVAACMGLPEEAVRVHLAGVGGAFGGREDMTLQIHAAMLASATGCPVKIEYSREESFLGHVHRHPARIWIEHSAAADGTLVSVYADILLDGGAYASTSAAVTANAAAFSTGPYRVPNAFIDATSVYTNNPPCGAMRGFGVPQACVAHEGQMDKLADALGIDPIELRLKNALQPGDTLPTGQVVTGSLPVREVIERCARLPVPEWASDRVGESPEEAPAVGFAVGFKNLHYAEGFDDSCAARVRLRRTAATAKYVAEVDCAAAEVGQGVSDRILEVARGELADLPVDVVRVSPSTASVGSSGSASASRMTWMASGAVASACRAARRGLDQRGGVLGDQVVDVERTYRHPPTAPLDPTTGQVTGERAHVAFACAAMRSVVEVDEDLGLARVIWIGAAQDVGRALDPLAIVGQIEGGAVQGLGLALTEELVADDGVIANPNFTDYSIPSIDEAPPIDVELVEEPEPDAPYGAKGVGEPSTVVATAAILSGLRNASGRVLERAPVRPEDLVEPEPIVPAAAGQGARADGGRLLVARG